MSSRHASTTDGDEEEADEAEGEGLAAARGSRWVSKATRQWCAPLARLRCSYGSCRRSKTRITQPEGPSVMIWQQEAIEK